MSLNPSNKKMSRTLMDQSRVNTMAWECARPRTQQLSIIKRITFIPDVPDTLACCARALCTLHISLKLKGEQESQRDSATKPRVASSELPSVKAREESATPTGLWLWGTTNAGTTPMGLSRSSRFFPRVARCSQPWAGGQNPFGILPRPARESKDQCK